MKLFVAVLPIFLIGLYIYERDKIKEPSHLLFKLFIGGVCSCFPAVILGSVFEVLFPEVGKMNVIQLTIYVFVVIALVEEFCKWFFVYKISYNHSEFDCFYDMIVYASFVSLGFACFENILYVMGNGILTGVIRAITAVPGHVCDGILMGSYLSLAKVNQVRGNADLAKKFKWYSIFVPVVTHGIYDLCLFYNHPIFILIFVIYVITLFIICIKKVNIISRNDEKFIFRNKYCIRCGNSVSSNFCTKCGMKNN